jgi:16S rRNA pseudouridine516 synthase
LQLAQLLFSQGFGTRRECAALIAQGAVRIGGAVQLDAQAEIAVHDGMAFEVQGRAWSFHAPAVVLLHKPAGYECSQRPRHHPSVLALLPEPLRRRGVQPVGRLDEDSTGALLLTDDGALLHRLTSPKHKLPKVYEVTARHPVSDAQIERLLAGVTLADDPRPAQAVACERTAERALRLTLTEGRYHQVKRMLAAVGNRVDALHRSAFGPVTLDPDALAPGTWRWLGEAEVGLLAANK